jgi:hypothetical protein
MRNFLTRGTAAFPLLVTVALLSGCAGTTVTASTVSASPSPATSSAAPTTTPSPTPTAETPLDPAPSNLALSNAASAIADVVAPVRDDVAAEGFTGYSGIEINNDVGVVDLFWKGKLPKRVLNVIKSFPKITTRIHATTLTLNDAEKAKHAVLDWAQADGIVDGHPMVASIGTSGDYSGLDVAVVETDGPVDIDAIQSALVEFTGVPIVVTVMSADDIPVAA